MIHFVHGDLFSSKYDVIVNAVNCVGVMGKGLALTFKQKYVENYAQYIKACQAHKLHPGQILIVQDHDQLIINAATKRHWKDESQEEWVIDAIVHIAAWLTIRPEIKSIAIPKLGCGLGGLSWGRIRPIMEDAFSDCPQEIYIFE